MDEKKTSKGMSIIDRVEMIEAEVEALEKELKRLKYEFTLEFNLNIIVPESKKEKRK